MSNGKKLPSQDGSSNHAKESRAASKRATGPRTAIGKERSKFNALKTGLFAQAALLKKDSREQLDALLQGLEQDFMPQGMSDKIDVEKLAADYWRYRRVLQIETSEMQKNIDRVAAERSRRADTIDAALEEHEAKTNRIGVLCEIEDYPESLQCYVERLCLIKTSVEMYGFDHSYATDLGFLYGARFSGRPGRDR